MKLLYGGYQQFHSINLYRFLAWGTVAKAQGTKAIAVVVAMQPSGEWRVTITATFAVGAVGYFEA